MKMRDILAAQLENNETPPSERKMMTYFLQQENLDLDDMIYEIEELEYEIEIELLAGITR